MPQVYLAILAPQAAPWTHALLAKKRVTNRFWKGALQTYTDPVNQAGQWALPGGKMGGTETVHEGAKPEFKEETGYDIQTQYPTIIRRTGMWTPPDQVPSRNCTYGANRSKGAKAEAGRSVRNLPVGAVAG